MTFLAIMTEEGGCKHSIGCGIRVVSIPSAIKTAKDAEQWLLDLNQDEDEEPHYGAFCGHDRGIVDGAVLYEVAGAQGIELNWIAKLTGDRRAAFHAPEIERAEREELCRLQEKYQGKGETE